jgi:hypothetical protein
MAQMYNKKIPYLLDKGFSYFNAKIISLMQLPLFYQYQQD